MKNGIVAVDFDGTIVTHQFPAIGEEIPGAFRVLRRLQKHGHKIILWTCREDDDQNPYLLQAVNFLSEHGIKLRSVNENLPDDEFRNPVHLRRKVFANVYLDDRNINSTVDWNVWEKWFEKHGWFEE